MSKNVTLRPVTESDDDFLLAVYASTRAEEMARVPWTAEQKEEFMRGQLLQEAAESSKPINIYVENFNPSLRLFKRLGFQVGEENGFQLLLKWSPKASQPRIKENREVP